ncbi:MAG: DUF4258 domain-containing protein [bacterium]
MDIAIIRERVRAGNYFAKGHAIQHALKEGFERKDMVEAVLNGKIIEEYPEDQRVLICSRVNLLDNIVIYLHVVCEYVDRVYVEFVTAYIPADNLWERPDFTRRKRKRK